MAQSNAIGWFDVYVSDMERAVTFYENVLQTKLEPIGDPTGETQMMAFPTDMGIYGAGGALVKSNHAQPGIGGTMVYFSVEDCSIQAARVASAGGLVIRPKFSIGEFGWVSICQDTEGNLFGLSSMK
jgi:predicted enzyme related to lactoylglutathione lyase